MRIFLSSPTHVESGSRGECGWEENVNGRTINMTAASFGPGFEYLGLQQRGYTVQVGPNARDGNIQKVLQLSAAFGPNVHLVAHSNANGAGCGDDAQYTLVMNKLNAQSAALQDALLAELDPIVPGGQNEWDCTNVQPLLECSAAAPNVVYVEMFFHTNQAATDWFMGDHELGCAAGCGWANGANAIANGIDNHLGNPRGLSSPEDFALDRVPGFGRSPEAINRDNTIALWEEFRRQQAVRSCMAEAHLEYVPDPAFAPDILHSAGSSLDIEAERLGTDSPSERNAAYVDSLSMTQQGRYFQTLFGETAADVAEVQRTGLLPAGRSEFATGGCYGRAWSSLSSIWEGHRTLSPALNTDIMASDLYEDARADYRDCAEDVSGLRLSSPADITPDMEAGQDIMIECEPVWAAGYDRAAMATGERFAASHADELDSIVQDYVDVTELIQADEGFRRFVAHELEVAEG